VIVDSMVVIVAAGEIIAAILTEEIRISEIMIFMVTINSPSLFFHGFIPNVKFLSSFCLE
jgi:hypothetical protein